MNFLKTNKNKLFITALLLLTFFISFWGMWNGNDWKNMYYSAAVKSMLSSWHNFFYASFDPEGYISVDKPALGLWLQCLFALIFGFKAWALVLPQSLAAVVSVGLLYKMVQKTFGNIAGLLAGLFLALTPIFIAVSKTNNLDSTLIMCIVIAAYFALKSIETNRFKYLLISVIFVGLGFNVKMVQAFVILPAIYITYFVFANTSIKKRIIRLTLLTTLLLAVSLSWCLAVDLTPKDKRPFVGGSSTNSEIALAAGYNGIMRTMNMPMGSMENMSLLTKGTKQPDANMENAQGMMSNMGGMSALFYSGSTGFTRLFDKDLGGLVGWLLPFGLIGFLAICINAKKKYVPANIEKRKALFFWSAFFLTLYLYFSFGGILHTYYTATFGPALAAMAAIGICEMWNIFKTNARIWFLLPVSTIITGVTQFIIISRHADWNPWLSWAVLISSLVLSLILVLSKIINKSNPKLQNSALAACIIALLIAPLLWTLTPMIYGLGSMLPTAGPELSSNYMKKSGKKDLSSIMNEAFGESNPKLNNFLLKNYNKENYLVAVSTCTTASQIMLVTDKPVMAVGGFTGSDNILTVDKLEKMIQNSKIRYFMIMDTPDISTLSMPSSMKLLVSSMMKNQDLYKWVKEHGKEVPTNEWKDDTDSSIVPEKNLKLYDLKVN